MPGRPRLQRGVQHVPQAEKTQFRQFVADAFDGKVDVHAGRAGKSRQFHAFAEAQGFEAGIAAAGGGAGFGFGEGVAKAGDQFPRQRIPLEQPEERAQRNVSVEFEPHPEKPREWGFGRKRPVRMQPDGVHDPVLLVASAASGRALVLGRMAFDAVLVVGTHERRASAGHVGLVAFGTGLIFRAHLGVYDAVFAAVVADDTVFDLGALVMVVVIEGDGGAAVSLELFGFQGQRMGRPDEAKQQRDGETGRKKIVAITRYLTVGLALIESGAMAIGFGRQGLLVKYNFVNAAIVVLTLTAGSAFLMWIGERITEKGVGNGISIVLVINIISRIPSDMKTLFDQFVKGKAIASACLAVCVIIAIILALVVFTVILQDGERRIAVQYSQKVVGRRSYGGQSTNIPLKVNTAGVIPIIFSSSLMQFPIVIASFLGKDNGSGIGSEILRGLNQSNWCNPEQIKYSWGLVLYIVLTVFFAYFYTSITFNPLEIANNMKKSGGFIPGIRPGKPTVDYLNKILKYIIFIGAAGLTIVAVVPFFFNGVFGASVSFGGTSIIIVVGVILETIKQIQSQLLVQKYSGFLSE